MDQLSIDDWKAAFASKIRVRSSESFSHLLCDVEDVDEPRGKKEALYKILFVDHKNSSFWYDYCTMAMHQFPSRKCQLQRLINKALETIGNGAEDTKLRQDKHYALLHGSLAALKSDEESLRYFEDIIWKKEIGLDMASIFIDWANVELRSKKKDSGSTTNMDEESRKRALAILQRGIAKNAEPRMEILSRIKELQSKSNGAFDDGEVAFNAKESSKMKSNDDSDNEVTVEVTAPVKAQGRRSSRGGTKITSSSSTSSSSAQPTLSSSSQTLKRTRLASSALGSASGLGKCQRVTVAAGASVGSGMENVSDSESDDDDSTVGNDEDVVSFKKGNVKTSTDQGTTSSEVLAKSRRQSKSDDKTDNVNDVVFKEKHNKISAKPLNNIELAPKDTTSTVSMTNTVKADIAKAHDNKKPGNAKTDLSRFVDDKLLNFDPNTFRKKQSTNKNEKSISTSISVSTIQTSIQSSSSTSTRATRAGVVVAAAAAATTTAAATKASTTTAAATKASTTKTATTTATNSINQKCDAVPHPPRPRLSLSDDDMSFDISICDTTRIVPAESIAAAVRLPGQSPPLTNPQKAQEENVKAKAHKEKTSAIDKKRVSFARVGESSEAAPLSACEIAAAQNGLKGAENATCDRKKPKKRGNEREGTADGGIGNSDAATSFASILKGENNSTPQLFLNGRGYIRLGVLGKGGSSCVHRVLSEDGNIYAYKRVDVRGDSESDVVFESYINEINLLRRLKGSSHIVDLVDAEINRSEMYIAMVMEAGEVDLAKALTQKQRTTNSSGGALVSTDASVLLNPFYARMVWQEMLEAVDHIHQNRIVHGDLKPANFIFVKGHLKLIDFGIAKAFTNDTTNIYRESQIGTVNYMAPEAIAPYTDTSAENGNGDGSKMRLGRASDIWSLGCILYQMIYGRPPFAALNTIQKLHAIPNPKHAIQYPDHSDIDAIDTIKACLVRDPRQRAQIRGKNGLLEHPYLCLKSTNQEKSNKQINSRSSSTSSTNSSNSDVTSSSISSDCTTERNIPLMSMQDIERAVNMVLTWPHGDLPDRQDAICKKVWCLLNRRQFPEEVASALSSSDSSNTPHLQNSDSRSNSKIIINSNYSGSCNSSSTNSGIISSKNTTINSNSDSNASIYYDNSNGTTNSGSKRKRSTTCFIGNDEENKPPSSIEADKAGSRTTRSTITAVSNGNVLNELQAKSIRNAHLCTSPHKSSNSATCSSASSKTSKTALKALPLNLLQQVQKSSASLESVSTSKRANKWMRRASPEKQDMRSVLERRIGEMRRFLSAECDENENDVSMDATEGGFF